MEMRSDQSKQNLRDSNLDEE